MAGGMRRTMVGSMAVEVVAVALLVLHLGSPAAAQNPGECCASGSGCTQPATPAAMFGCSDQAVWNDHMDKRPWEWYITPGNSYIGNTVTRKCAGGTNAYQDCTTDANCGGGGTCAVPAISARQYMKDYLSCCRHCAWDMLFPFAAPIQVIPVAVNSTHEIYPVLQKMDCFKWRAEFDAMDGANPAHTGRLVWEEFRGWFTQSPNEEMVAGGMLDDEMVFWTADLNKNNAIEYEEFVVLRHYWTPVLLSNTAPASEVGNNADGPLGGLFYDDATVSVWVTTANNILLNAYQAVGWPAAKTRQPRSHEEQEMKRLSDLDGSTRISLEEHYFRHFADINQDGVLTQAEYDRSLYSPLTTASAPATWQSSLTWAAHDINSNGEISWLERKRIFADRNMDGKLSYTEWTRGDYPALYGPFHGHTASGSQTDAVALEQYRYYMLYHFCTIEGSMAYSRPISKFPWHSSCPINVTIKNQKPFVVNDYGFQTLSEGNSSFGGFVTRVWTNVTARLLWSYQFNAVPTDTNLSIAAPNLQTQSFNLVIMTEHEDVPSSWVCSEAMWPEDGFVVVVRADDLAVNLYIIAGKLVVSPHFVNFFCSLFFTVLIVGHVIWGLERWQNGEVFRPFYGEGVMDGLWWSIVTQTTVGYGDKAPGTGPGKVFAIFWMLFGLIMFGVFSGQVTAFIEEQTAVNNIADATSLGGFTVGTLEKTRNLNLYTIFSFTNKNCITLEECGEMLKSEQVDAIVAPRADVVAWFRNSGQAMQKCGNDFKIVGTTIAAEYITQAKPAVRVCGFGLAVYASTYLTQAVSEVVANMSRDGSLNALLQEERNEIYPPADDDHPECEDKSPWELGLIVTAILLLIFYSALIYVSENEMIQKLIKKAFHLEGEAEGGTEAEPESSEADSGNGSGDKKDKPKKNLEDEEGDLPPLLTEEHVEEMIESSKRLGVFSAMQATDVRRMQREMKEQRYLLERMLKFFALCSGVVLCSLAAMVGILMVIWGDEIQVADYR